MCVVLVSKDSLTSEIKMYYYYYYLLDIGYRATYSIKTCTGFPDFFFWIEGWVGGVNCIQTFFGFLDFFYIYKVP